MDEFYRDIFSKPDRPEHPGQEWIINTLIDVYHQYPHKQGEPVPSEKSLARFLKISSQTVQKAYNCLRARNNLFSVNRQATYLAISTPVCQLSGQFSVAGPFQRKAAGKEQRLQDQSRLGILLLGDDSPVHFDYCRQSFLLHSGSHQPL